MPLVLLHGFCEDSRMWEDWLVGFEAYHILRIDLPGFGRSESIPDLSIEKMAEVVLAVLDQHKIKKCILLGHSMGGYVGLAVARRFPDRLAALGLFHSHPFADSPEKLAQRQKGIEFIEKTGHIYFVKQLFHNLFPSAFIRSNQMLVDKLIFRASQLPPQNIIAAIRAMMDRPDESAVLEQLDFPVLCIMGVEDRIVPDNHLDQAAMPAIGSIHILPKVAHMGMFELKKKTQRIVRQFIAFVSA